MAATSTRTYVVAAAYGAALGAGGVLLPLLALDAGHSAARIGWFAGSGALAHVVARSLMGLVLRRFPDRVLIAGSAVALVTTFAVVWAAQSAVAFVVAMSLEGISRAWFWTGIQTHVVRGTENLGSSLARVTLAGSVGLVVGPALAGACLDASPGLALGLSAACGVLAFAFSIRLRRWPPFDPPVGDKRVRVWRRRPVVVGAVGTGVAGCWRGLLSSYVPVVLVASGQTTTGVGLAVALASAANTVAALVLVRWQPQRPDRLIAFSCAATGISLGLVGVVGGSVHAVVGCLMLSGYGAGLLHVVGSTMAAQGVHPEERGDVLALTGMVRAGSIMVSPVAVAVMLPAMPLAAALLIVGAVLSAPFPALLSGRRGP